MDRCDDRQEGLGRMAVLVGLPEHVRQLDELVDLARPLLLVEPLPVGRELPAVEVVRLDPLFLQQTQVGGRRAREHVHAEAAQLELARRRAEDLARLLEHVVDERARLVVHEPAAPAALVVPGLEDLQNLGSSWTRVRTGANRSPSRATRRRTSSCSKTSIEASPASRQASTSSQVTG